VSEEGLKKITARIASKVDIFNGTLPKVSLEDWSRHQNVSIVGNAYSHRYSHSNTMSVEIEEDEDGETFYDELTEEKLLEAIKEDVKQTSRELEALGYSLLYPKETDEETDEDIAAIGLDYTFNGSEFIASDDPALTALSQTLRDREAKRGTKTFSLQIEMGNDMMRTRMHLASALTDVAIRLRRDKNLNRHTIVDVNGNKVGTWEVTND
jgi:hypothetical protein